MSHTVFNSWKRDQKNTATADTLLECLKEARVFTIVRQEEGDFAIVEHCDEFFAAYLTPEQLLILADEIRQLANG